MSRSGNYLMLTQELEKMKQGGQADTEMQKRIVTYKMKHLSYG